jgi:hypothetical protein
MTPVPSYGRDAALVQSRRDSPKIGLGDHGHDLDHEFVGFQHVGRHEPHSAFCRTKQERCVTRLWIKFYG